MMDAIDRFEGDCYARVNVHRLHEDETKAGFCETLWLSDNPDHFTDGVLYLCRLAIRERWGDGEYKLVLRQKGPPTGAEPVSKKITVGA
jgi:hypothetical protein